MNCIHTFAAHLWLNAEGVGPDYERGFSHEISSSRIEGTPQFERYREVVQELLDRLPALWIALILTKEKAPDQNCLNWTPSFTRHYAEVALMEIRLHMLY